MTEFLNFAFAMQVSAGITSLLSVWCMGNKTMAGPIMGLVSQIAWYLMIWSNGVWGLLPLTVCMTFTHARNLRKWLREGR